MKSSRKITKNVLVGGVTQLLTMALSLVIPRLMIVSFGSDVNGLVSTIVQAFSYLTLLEAGIGGASVVRLYKDIAQEDEEGINTTLSATNQYFMRIIPIYALFVALFMLVFPYIIQSNVAPATIRLIILIRGLNGIVNFAFTNTFSLYLSADGRHYVQTILNFIMQLISSLGQIILINNGFSVIAVQCIILFATAVKAVSVQVYVRHSYPGLHLRRGVSPRILEQKSAHFVHELTNVIFLSTDVFVIGIYCGTTSASVYAIYQLIFHSLKSIVSIIDNSVNFKLGHIYNGAREKYEQFHDAYESAYSAIVFACMSATLYLTLPFVSLYTEGVTDAAYVDAKLPLLFALIQVLSCTRSVCTKLISVAGHANKTVVKSIIEAFLNLSVSIILASRIGIYGVLIGTIVALLYRSNDIIIYANLKILKRKPIRCYATHAVYYVLFAGNFVLSRILPLPIHNYFAFVLFGAGVTAAMLMMYGGAMLAMSASLRKEASRQVNKWLRKVAA